MLKYLQSIDSDAFVIRWKDVSYISLPMVCVLCGVAYPAVIVGSLLGLTVLLGCKWTTTVNSKCLQPILFTLFAMDHFSVDPSERSMETIVSKKCVSGFDCTIYTCIHIHQWVAMDSPPRGARGPPSVGGAKLKRVPASPLPKVRRLHCLQRVYG